MATKHKANRRSDSDGTMSVNEAGQRGGLTTRDKYGHTFYEDIGHKGGQRVKELIEEGKQAEGAARKTVHRTDADWADRTDLAA
jgi:hypothetical protein